MGVMEGTWKFFYNHTNKEELIAVALGRSLDQIKDRLREVSKLALLVFA